LLKNFNKVLNIVSPYEMLHGHAHNLEAYIFLKGSSTSSDLTLTRGKDKKYTWAMTKINKTKTW